MNTSPTIMGVETEYALVSCADGAPPSSDALSDRLLELARSRLPHVLHKRLGIVLGNGARFYIDSGAHPEWSTAECVDPDQLVAHVRAGERHLRDLLAELPDTVLFRGNVQYEPQNVTWGSHESYAYRGDLTELGRFLVPHFASRVIITGAGGLDPLHAGAIISLSPRALMGIGAEMPALGRQFPSWSRAEPSWKRAHFRAGETLRLDLPMWLRVATTALLVRLADEGRAGPDDLPVLPPDSPAMSTFASDPTLSRTVITTSGEHVTALDIQHRCLELVARHADAPWMPEWAPRACDRWGEILETLGRDPKEAWSLTDWGLKRSILEDQAARSGFDDEALAFWNDLLEQHLPDARRRASNRLRGEVVHAEIAIDELDRSGTLASEERDGLRGLLDLRRRLCDLDMRFAQVPDGIFDAIEPELTEGGIPEVTEDRVRRAMVEAPAGTRARVRGRLVHRHCDNPEQYRADWSIFVDQTRRRAVRFDDPRTTRARWSPLPDSMVDETVELGTMSELSRVYNRGDLGALLRQITALRDRSGRVPSCVLPYEAWALSRTGDLRAASRSLRRLSVSGDHPTLPSLYVTVYRYRGLMPFGRPLARWIARSASADCSGWCRSTTMNLLGHKGYVLGRKGRLEEAVEALTEAASVEFGPPNHQRLTARMHCDLADCLRILGRREAAAEELDRGQAIFERHDHHGELADHALVTRAKLQDGPPDERIDLLRRARAIQTRMGNPIGVVRSALLMARIAGPGRLAGQARRLARRHRSVVPDLQSCPLLGHILERWDQWVAGAPRAGDRDPFWSL